MRKFIQIIAESYLNFAPRLNDEREIAIYIEDWASDYVDTDMIEERFFGCHAVLKLVPIDEIKEGNPDTNIRSKAKEKRYSKLDPATIPPLVIEDGEVQDGNHRFRVAKAQGAKALWCYVVEEG
jgi:hypothetical protein